MNHLVNQVRTQQVRRFEAFLPLAMLLALVVCLLGAATPHASAETATSMWGASCYPNSDDTGIITGPRCIAGAELRTRGYFTNPACVELPPVAGWIYPSKNWCGGRGAGPEAIAQSRAISHLSGGGAGVDPDVQWEVMLWQTTPPAPRYADLVYYDHENAGYPVQVYELKQTESSDYSNRGTQLNQYISLLQSKTSHQVIAGGELASWVDLFMIDTQVPCGNGLRLYDVYVSWQSAPGLFDIYRYRPPCFNPRYVPVPRPVDVPSYVNLPNLPDPIFETPKPFPGTPWPETSPPPLIPPPVETPTPTTPNPPVPPPSTDPNSPDWTCGLSPSCSWNNMQDWWAWFKENWENNSGGPYGDPHIVTLDGLHYDLQSVGEFEAVRADAYGLRIQARFVPSGNSISIARAVAFDLSRHTIQISVLPTSTSLYIDHEPFSLAVGSMLDFGDGALLLRKSDGYYVTWPGTGSRPALGVGSSHFRLYVPPNTNLLGLLGNADGDPTNDLADGFGTVLPANTSPTVLHGTFADTWRITNEESRFTYASGQSTETFTDRTFPSSIVTVGDLSDSALADATSRCEEAGVVDGTQFEDCVIDWALTQDAQYVSAAAAPITPAMEGGARLVDANGVAAESFNGAVAPNFAAARYGAGPAAGAFAGPFGRDGRYVFYVPAIPAHSSGVIEFDLVAIGDWTTNASSNTVSLEVGGVTVWTGAVATGTPSSTGTLSTGQPYAVYPVSVNVAHTGKQLNAGITAPIPIGSSRVFGIDNVEASFTLVPPQTFDVTIPLSASNGVPSAGAGNLETGASEDIYRFTAGAGDLQIDVASCSSSLGYYVEWDLLKEQNGEVVASEAGCASTLVPNVAAGQYRLSVTRNGASGTYAIGAYTAPAPQTFNVTLPVSASNGSPAGAGNLETTASQDVYAFTTSSDGKVQVDLSSCSSSLGYYVDWKLVDAGSGVTVYSTSGCGSKLVPNVPAGQYRLVVTRNGRSGTYAVGIALQPAPEVFDVSLPVTVSNGVPAAGAGNLETTSSEDVYRFTTTAAGGVQVDVSNCAGSLGYYVTWSLINEQTGAVLHSTSGCASVLVQNVPAASLRVSVTRNGNSGTYNLGILVQPPPQSFDVTPPVTISNGVPAAGAGNLETTASEDRYRFTSASANDVQIDFSNCAGSLGYYVDWKLVDEQSGSTVYSTSGCASKRVTGVPAGQFRVVVTRNGKSGTYNLGISLVPPPQVFNVTLPVTVTNGVPAAGAGNLETTSSEDRYVFTTTAAGGVQFDFSNCAGSLGYYVDWKLVDNQSGTTVYSTSACASKLVANVPAGEYRLVVTRNGSSGTYSVGILVQPAPQSFDVSLPVSIANGVPGAGAGNLETTASEDRYVFTTTAAGALQFDFANCGGTLGYYVEWKIVDVQSGSTIFSTSACTNKLVPNVPAGQYRLVVTRNGGYGTYSVGILVQPAAQVFDVSLPASISNGVPASGAGNLETTASEDDYRFTTTATGTLQAAFANCGSTLGYYVAWKLVNEQTGNTVYSTSACSTKTISALPAGQYRIVVTRNGGSGTYTLGLSLTS